MTSAVTVATGACWGAVIGSGTMLGFPDSENGIVTVFVMARRALAVAAQNKILRRVIVIIVKLG